MRLCLLTVLLTVLPCAFPAAAQPGSEAQARRLLNSQGCKACHLLDGDGGSIAPDLSKVGSRLTREQLHGQLVNPQHRHGGQIGDFSHLQDQEIDALVTFLSQRQ